MSVTVCPNGHIHSEHECRLCKPVKKEVCPVCMGTGDDYDYEGGSGMCGACLGTGKDKAALALSSADSSGSDNVPLPSGSGEQPTSVEDKIKEAIDYNYLYWKCGNEIDGIVPAILSLVAEERRQAKIEELERLQLEFGLLDTPQPDWEGTTDQKIYNRLNDLRGENNE